MVSFGVNISLFAVVCLLGKSGKYYKIALFPKGLNRSRLHKS